MATQSEALWNLHAPPVPNLKDHPDTVEVMIESDDDSFHIDPTTGAMEIPTEDGGVIIDFNPPKAEQESSFDENLADKLGEDQLSAIASRLIEGIESDEESRADWLTALANGLDLLGLKLELAGSSATSTISAPLSGMSRVRHPLLLEAVLRFQANARGELLPASGPVKVRNDGDETGVTDDLAHAYERDMNHYLTVGAPEYYPDTDRLLFTTGLSGAGFKKVYRCPIRRRPVSESVDSKDLIVSDAATDLRSAGRVTQRITMRPSVMRRMQVIGAYRDVPLTQPTARPNPVDQKEALIQGIRVWTTRPEDQPYTLYECYCEENIPGYEHKEDGKETGLALPYRVTIEVDTRTVLAIHRNWHEGDSNHEARRVFVKYPYVQGLGFYGVGLLHILGNSTMALTAAWREALDAGMFASFPGFLISKTASRQNTNEFRVAPGSGQVVDTGAADITKAIMPLPYKDVTPGLMTLIDKITEASRQVGSTAEVNVGEGNAEVPVGTTLALIEQATKIESAVHKRLHAAQSEEFQLLRDLFIEDPESLWRSNNGSAVAALLGIDPASVDVDQAQLDKFKAALANYNLVPVADPNTPSHVHRLMKAVALKQLQAASPTLYDAKQVDSRILKMIGWSNPEELFAPPAPPPEAQVDPATQQMLAIKAQEVQIKQQKAQMDGQLKAADNQAKIRIAELNLQKELVIHNDDQKRADRQHQIELARMANENNLNRQRQGLAVAQAQHSAALQLRQQDISAAQAARQDRANQDRQAFDKAQAARKLADQQNQHALNVAKVLHGASIAERQHDLAEKQAGHAAKMDVANFNAPPVPQAKAPKKPAKRARGGRLTASEDTWPKLAPDGEVYSPDPSRPGKYLKHVLKKH